MSSGTSADRVWSLPSSPPLSTANYAGFVLSNHTHGNHMFYWFVESSKAASGESPPGDLPLIIWLNGGPGASSITGLLIEGIGPLGLADDGQSLTPNAAPWTDLGHVLALDNPVGSGFSYSERGLEGLAHSLEQIAKELRTALLAFYELHPLYARCPLYLAGESFAGKYIPFLATHIRHANAHATRQVPLAGVAIGNGVLQPLRQYTSLLQVAPALGYADDTILPGMRARLAECEAKLAAEAYKEAYAACQSVEDGIYGGALPFVYDVRETSDKFDAVSYTHLTLPTTPYV